MIELLLASALVVSNALVVIPPGPSSPARSVTLAWDVSPSPEVLGYNIYFGPGSRTYTNKTDAGNSTCCTVSNLAAGATYFFAATAYDLSFDESDMSPEVCYTTPAPEKVVRIKAWQSGSLNGPWITNPAFPEVCLTNPVNAEFFRLSVTNEVR